MSSAIAPNSYSDVSRACSGIIWCWCSLYAWFIYWCAIFLSTGDESKGESTTNESKGEQVRQSFYFLHLEIFGIFPGASVFLAF